MRARETGDRDLVAMGRLLPPATRAQSISLPTFTQGSASLHLGLYAAARSAG
ncbi:MAG TPA: hypothetical protein VK208_16830 [Pyrinomonadaceae bacterium]|nr:hypothetical protein [Pyrinomonadaceae bacterium]